MKGPNTLNRSDIAVYRALQGCPMTTPQIRATLSDPTIDVSFSIRKLKKAGIIHRRTATPNQRIIWEVF